MNQTNPTRPNAMSPHRAWGLWLFVACTTSAVHLTTLRISPPIWQDEVEIVELGRNALPGGDHSWSTLWSPKGRPIRILNYVGPCLQELACRLGGGSEIGPRLSTLIGALLAGTCFLGWLLRRQCRPLAALICASLLLLDPVFAQSWRGARVDCWVFGFIFMACWLIWRASSQKSRGSRSTPSLLAAGACLSLAGFCWASAVLLVPLVVHEVIAAYRSWFTRKGIAEMVPILLTLAGGTAVTFSLLLLPIWSFVGSSVGSTGAAVAASSQHASLLSVGSAIAQSLWLSPWVFGIGLLALSISANHVLLVAFLVAALGVSMTNPYIHRVLYLLPYLLLSLSTVFAFGTQRETKSPVYIRSVLVAVWLLIGWSATITLGARTWNAWRQREARSPDRIMEVALATVGARAAAVFTPCYEFYYAGRRLGWRQFHLFDYGASTKYEGISPAFLGQMQFVILPASEDTDAKLSASLREAGFILAQRVHAATSHVGTIVNTRVGAVGFGGYLFFVRR